MQEFWATVSTYHHSLRFKLNGISHTLNVENFRDMLHIYPRLPGQKFEDPPLEEEILFFTRDLGHTREIKVLTDVNVNYMHQPWRSFAAIINRCLSGKTTSLDNFKAYKEYYAVASRAEPPKAKTKYKKKTDEYVTSPKSKTASTSKGTILKSKAKVTKPNIKKQPTKKTKAKGLDVLSEVALSEAKQIKMATKRSKQDFYISHASGSCYRVDTQSKVPDKQVQKTSGTDEGTDSEDEDDNDDDDDGDNDDDAESDDHDDDNDDE
nr:hypothetical protein [Tanacetum cinerariifolium]